MINSSASNLHTDQWKTLIKAGAIGDAFGYQVEFDSWLQIQITHGEQGLTRPPERPIPISDDTQMTLFSIEGTLNWLQHEGQNSLDFKQTLPSWTTHQIRSFLDWYETQHFQTPMQSSSNTPEYLLKNNPGMRHRQAPGITCLRALRDLSEGNRVHNDSKGCGGIMRVGGAVLLALTGATPDEVWKAGADQAFITHLHVDGVVSSGVLSYVLASAPSSKQALEHLLRNDVLPRLQGSSATGTIQAIQLALQYKDSDLSPNDIPLTLGQGWVGDEALAIGLWAAFRSESLFQAIVLATNHDGDSDSTASISGQLASFLHPWDESCENTYQLLDAKPIIDRMLRCVDRILLPSQKTTSPKL